MESNLTTNKMLEAYNNYKNKLKEIFDNIAEEYKAKAKSLWYEAGDKSSAFFLT